MTAIRILLADDHHLVRAGIKMLLTDVADFTVVGETGDGRDAVRLAGELLPDIVVMDIAMPGMTGLQALEEIKAKHPEIRVAMLSVHGTEEHARNALRLGAAGYVLKNAAPAELELAIRAAMDGEIYLSATISRQLVEAYLARSPNPDRHDVLTARQHEVLKMLADGKRTKEIAFTLSVSVKTIETYRSQIMNRLGIQDVAGLVRYAIRHGISEL